MRRTLDNLQITIVEAVYVCTMKKPVSQDMQDALVELLRKNLYMYVHLMVVISLASIILKI